MTSRVTYQGNLRTTSKHLASGDEFMTDAPVDNNGLGKAFSPTDAVATGLASCMLTVIGIKPRDLAVNLKGALAEVTKHMASDPRRITKIEVLMHLPNNISEKNQVILKRTADTCPVHHSLHPILKK